MKQRSRGQTAMMRLCKRDDPAPHHFPSPFAGELGDWWYEMGRAEHKQNTFIDLEACAEYLVRTGWTTHSRLILRGASAGGLAVAAALNRRPDVAQAAVLNVPFVDVLTDMLDSSLPLTRHEFDEWGNPQADVEAYNTILAYSPVDNVAIGARYPHLFVTAAWRDWKVGYWEPAKYVAKIRELGQQGEGKALLRVSMTGAHEGELTWTSQFQSVAEQLAFMLTAVGMERRVGASARAPQPPNR